MINPARAHSDAHAPALRLN